MKILLICLTVFLLSCKEDKNFDCDNSLAGNVGFMIHGGFFDQYNNGKHFLSIVKVVNPKNWDNNEYFTGEGFTKDEKLQKKVLENDSCQLKELYFEYLHSGIFIYNDSLRKKITIMNEK